MKSILSREVRLARRPLGKPTLADFALESVDVRAPEAGEARVRNLWMSVDPYMAGRLYDGDSYVAPFKVGRALDGAAIGVVTDSNDSRFAPGDLVSSMYGWREAFTARAERLTPIDAGAIPPQAFLGVAGITGMTAYVGLFAVGRLQPGEVAYISAAAGAVGSVACQMAKLRGTTVIGSAGGEAKRRFLTGIGVDHAIDYRAGNLDDALRAAAPDGIDFYFDNVGGPQLEAAFANMKDFGRIAVCGMISQYAGSEASGPRNMFQIVAKRLTLTGFLVMDHIDARGDFERDVRQWLADGRLQAPETILDGIEAAPEAFLMLFEGGNLGKMLVRLSD